MSEMQLAPYKQCFQGRRWPKELEEEVREKWLSGLSASQIARPLGMTRSAIIGKIHRLGIDPRPQDVRIRSVVVTARRRKRDRTKELERAKLKRRLERERLIGNVVDMSANGRIDSENPGIGILELNGNTCRSVLRHGPDGMALYCGEATVDKASFCPRHCSIYYNYQARMDSRPFRLSR